MNKQKFIDYLRSPKSLTEGQLEDLNKSLADFPYFSIGRSIAAKASKELSHESKGALTATAAIYSTDRKHLKKYINGELVFLAGAPTVPVEIIKDDKSQKEVPAILPNVEVAPSSTNSNLTEKETEATTSSYNTLKMVSDGDLHFDNLKAPSGEDVDQMLDELQHNMSELRKSRRHFVDIQNHIEEEEAVSAALRRATKKVGDIVIKETEEAKPSSSGFVKKTSPKREPKIQELDNIEEDLETIEAGSNRGTTEPLEPSINPNVEIEKTDEEDEGLPPSVSALKSKKSITPKSKTSDVSGSKRIKIKRSDLNKAISEGEVLKKGSPLKNSPPEKKETAKSKTIKVEQEKKNLVNQKVKAKPQNKRITPAEPSSKAFLHTGKTSTSTSVSKSSPSKREKKASASKSSTKEVKSRSKFTGDEKKGRKNNDDSGGTDRLINKFIKKSPSIKRKPKSDNTSDLSINSTTWNPDIASEYLAELYLDQGNPQRAITIYEALSLKFPEKKSYFADLIQEIKK